MQQNPLEVILVHMKWFNNVRANQQNVPRFQGLFSKRSKIVIHIILLFIQSQSCVFCWLELPCRQMSEPYECPVPGVG